MHSFDLLFLGGVLNGSFNPLTSKLGLVSSLWNGSYSELLIGLSNLIDRDLCCHDGIFCFFIEDVNDITWLLCSFIFILCGRSMIGTWLVEDAWCFLRPPDYRNNLLFLLCALFCVTIFYTESMALWVT
uniref:Uncharacterized protein n=1 Tax=Opuntia streptacantha TaxID=393608 RepID=A0A7C8YK56_OPUST